MDSPINSHSRSSSYEDLPKQHVSSEHAESASSHSSQKSASAMGFKFKRTKPGIGYSGESRHKSGDYNRSREDRSETISGDNQILQTLIKKDPSPTKESSSKESKSLLGRITMRKPSKDLVFPYDSINTAFKKYDEKTYLAHELIHQLASQLKGCSSDVIIEGLAKYRRLEVLALLGKKDLKIEGEKLIRELLRGYFLKHAGGDGSNGETSDLNFIFNELINFRHQVPDKHRQVFDNLVFTWIPLSHVGQYESKTESEILKCTLQEIDLVEKMMIQALDSKAYLFALRGKTKGSDDQEKLSIKIAKSGNPNLFIPYIIDVFVELSSQNKPLDEVRRSMRQFLIEIKSIYLGDANKIYAIMIDIQNQLKAKVIGNTAQIDDFFDLLILQDGSPALINILFQSRISELNSDSNAIPQLIELRKKIMGQGYHYLALGLDQEVIRRFSIKQILEYARDVFNLFDSTEEQKSWGKSFINSLEDQKKLISFTRKVVKSEMSSISKASSPLRGNTAESFLFSHALGYSMIDLGVFIFNNVKESLANDEDWAKRFWAKDSSSGSSNLTMLVPEALERIMKSFVARSKHLMDLMIKKGIPDLTVDLLMLARKGFYHHIDQDGNKDYEDSERREIVANLWILRGLGTVFMEQINAIPSGYSDRLQDPVLGVLTQFLNRVLLKITVPDTYANKVPTDPLRLFHEEYHPKVMEMYENEISNRRNARIAEMSSRRKSGDLDMTDIDDAVQALNDIE
jgi:hypothetical protein